MFICWGVSVGRDCDAQLQHTKLFPGAITWSPADLLCTRDPSVWNCIIEDSFIPALPFPCSLTFYEFIFSWGLTNVQWGVQILNIQSELWQIYIPMDPPLLSIFTFYLPQKVPLWPFLVIPCPFAHPTWQLFWFVRLVWPVLELHIHGTQQYVLFWVWLLSLSVMVLRFSHIAACTTSSLLLMLSSIPLCK